MQCWLILPLRTGDVLKRRVADALAALSDFLGTPIGDGAEAQRRGAHFLQAVELLEQIAKPLRTHRILTRRGRGTGGAAPHPAEAIDAVRACVAPVAILAVVFAETPSEPPPSWARLQGAVAANVGAVWRTLGGRPGTP